MRIIITIPAHNEEKNIGKVIESIKSVMGLTKYKNQYKILVVNDGSKDRTAEIAKGHGAIVYSHPYNYGLAETFRTEIQKCLELKADVILHIDADGQYLASEIPTLLKEIENGYDLVLGSRFMGIIEEMPTLKRLGNIAFSKVISNITNFKITDCQTGFRAFTKDIATGVPVISTHTYTQEQIIRAIKQKYKIKEVPVYFARRYGKSRLIKNPIEYAIKAWINILRVYRDYEPLKFFGTIGTISVIMGLAIGLWLFTLFVTTGVVGHYPSLILCFLLITTGIQIILFGFLADMKKNQ
ncbi:glycosyltransferase family 2 protein [Candidatus Woesearchaeota archaeon]|nr:glycosyltransferase family 2 protein [Candidatus Woesearchaeota archaeon]